jgi:predicted NBD/HSP70 family sugar kinase
MLLLLLLAQLRTMEYKWGVDMGGTKIEGVILDEDNNVVFRHRIATEAEGGYEHIVSQIQIIDRRDYTHV